jgi:hypothetical protein
MVDKLTFNAQFRKRRTAAVAAVCAAVVAVVPAVAMR